MINPYIDEVVRVSYCMFWSWKNHEIFLRNSNSMRNLRERERETTHIFKVTEKIYMNIFSWRDTQTHSWNVLVNFYRNHLAIECATRFAMQTNIRNWEWYFDPFWIYRKAHFPKCFFSCCSMEFECFFFTYLRRGSTTIDEWCIRLKIEM